ncbi:hypothetical protein ACU8V3_14245 [Cobetia marina]
MNQVMEGLAPQRVDAVRRPRLDWPLRRVIGAAMVASLVLLALLGNLVIPGDPLDSISIVRCRARTPSVSLMPAR